MTNENKKAKIPTTTTNKTASRKVLIFLILLV